MHPSEVSSPLTGSGARMRVNSVLSSPPPHRDSRTRFGVHPTLLTITAALGATPKARRGDVEMVRVICSPSAPRPNPPPVHRDSSTQTRLSDAMCSVPECPGTFPAKGRELVCRPCLRLRYQKAIREALSLSLPAPDTRNYTPGAAASLTVLKQATHQNEVFPAWMT